MSSSAKPIVTDTYDFPTLIRDGYVYVDKTALLARLISKVDGRCFFMSRPRRFGKSLMISTLEQIFKGNKALFKGLDISRLKYDWQSYPVIHLDMSELDPTRGTREVCRDLSALIAAQMKAAGLEIPGSGSPGILLGCLIDGLAKRSKTGQVVILVDEYDNPISGLLGRPKELDAMQQALQHFYSIFKSRVARIRFLKMAGADITPELESSKGRADAIVETGKAVYVFEFKYGKTARAALKQIAEKGYAKPCAADRRRVVMIGVNYDPRKAGIAAVSEVVNSSDEVVNSVDEVVNEVVKSHPGLRKPELVPLVGKSRATVERALASLILAKRVEFRGAPKTGGYYVREDAARWHQEK